MIKETFDYARMKDRVLFTSDLHSYHRLVLKHRNFENFDDMHNKLIENWNLIAKQDSVVFILGDLSFGKPEQTLEFLNKLNGRLYLISGNHDKKKNLKLSYQKFVNIADYGELDIFNLPDTDLKKRICMFHFPILRWNKAHYGSIMLHGHTHDSLVGRELPNSYDVGVDCNFLTPVPLSYIYDRFSKTDPKLYLNHHETVD